MANKLVLLGTTALMLGASLVVMDDGAVTPPSGDRTWSYTASFKATYGLEHTNILLGANPLQDVKIAGGATRYGIMQMRDAGHIGPDNTIASMPVDAQIESLNTGALINIGSFGMKDAPDFFNGRTLVLRVNGGTIGDGNSLTFGNAGGGAQTIVNSTGAAYRVEKVIQDVANWVGEFIVGIQFGGTAGQQSRLDQLAALASPKIELFFKDEEALVDDIPNNPWKGFSPIFRERLDNFDWLRAMDLVWPMGLGVTHMKDIAKVTDQNWFSNQQYWGQETFMTSGPSQHIGRAGLPYDAFLNLCEFGSPTGKKWGAHVNLPCNLCSPVRFSSKAYYDAVDKNYWVDGVQFTRNRSDCVFWFDPAFVDFSTLSLVSQPANGQVTSVNTTTGEIVYNPEAGTPVVGDQRVPITFQFKRKNYDASGNATTNADFENFIVRVRCIPWGNNDFLCRADGLNLWSDNLAWFQDMDKWRAAVRPFRDAIVASGYDPARLMKVEWGNENWNTAIAFEANTILAQGQGNAHLSALDAWRTARGKGYTNHQQNSGAIALAYFRKAFDDVCAETGVSFNIEWVVGTQTFYGFNQLTGVSSADVTKSIVQTHRFVWEAVHGLSVPQADAKMAKLSVHTTMYTGCPLVGLDVNGTFDTDRNITGLTGAAHAAEILDRFDGTKPGYASDSTTLEDEYIAHLQDPSHLFVSSAYGHMAVFAQEKAAIEAEGAVWGGNYEGGNHEDDNNFPNELKNSARVNSLGQTFKQWIVEFHKSEKYANFVRFRNDLFIAEWPDFGLCQYGGLYPKSSGEPWAWGHPFLPPTPEGAAILEYGRLAE